MPTNKRNGGAVGRRRVDAGARRPSGPAKGRGSRHPGPQRADARGNLCHRSTLLRPLSRTAARPGPATTSRQGNIPPPAPFLLLFPSLLAGGDGGAAPQLLRFFPRRVRKRCDAPRLTFCTCSLSPCPSHPLPSRCFLVLSVVLGRPGVQQPASSRAAGDACNYSHAPLYCATLKGIPISGATKEAVSEGTRNLAGASHDPLAVAATTVVVPRPEVPHTLICSCTSCRTGCLQPRPRCLYRWLVFPPA